MLFNLEEFINELKQHARSCVNTLCSMPALDIQGVWVEIYWRQSMLNDMLYAQIVIHEPENNNRVHSFATYRIYLGQDMLNFDESIDNAVRVIASLGLFKSLMTYSLGPLRI